MQCRLKFTNQAHKLNKIIFISAIKQMKIQILIMNTSNLQQQTMHLI